MYGWRARFGVIVGSSIVVVEPDYNKMAPEGVTCHFNRTPFRGGRAGLAPGEPVQPSRVIEELRGVGTQAVDAVDLLAHLNPSAIAIAWTAPTFVGGAGYDKMLIQKMQERSGNIPATTTSTAAVDALKALGAKKISLATPYPEELVKLQEEFLTGNGFEVLHATWITTRTTPASEISAKTVYNLAVESNRVESEAIFVSCANLHTIDLIEKLEEDLKKPVITSNQATVWRLLRLVNISTDIKGYGQLFQI